MRFTNHSSDTGIEVVSNVKEPRRGTTLEELILALLEGEFAGVIRSHVRGEVYGGR